MQTTKTPRHTKVDEWLNQHTSVIFEYAKKDEVFAEALASHIQKQDWYNSSTHEETGTVSPYLIPSARNTAVRNVNWLLQNIEETTNKEKHQAILSTWARQYESPKDIAIGIIGIMIMGPTLGIVEKTKKKKKAHLQVVIENEFYNSLTKAKLVKLVQELSMQLIAGELKLAKGNAYQLHPDSAEWLLAESVTKVFVDTKENLISLKKTAKAEGLNFIEAEAGKVLVVSPSVNDEFVDDSGAELV